MFFSVFLVSCVAIPPLCPWERKSLRTLVRTAKLALLRPNEFFSTLPLTGKGAWSFAIALGWPATILGAICGRLTGLDKIGDRAAEVSDATRWGMALGQAAVAPLSIAIGIAIYGGIMHLFLRMFGGTNAKVETTMRTYAYAHATMLFAWIPVLGPVVMLVWMPILLVIGLRRMHQTSLGKVIAAIFIPMAVFIALLVLSLIAVFATKHLPPG